MKKIHQISTQHIFQDNLRKCELSANTSVVNCLTTSARIKIDFNSQLLYQLSYRGISMVIYNFFIPKSNSDEFLMNYKTNKSKI